MPNIRPKMIGILLILLIFPLHLALPGNWDKATLGLFGVDNRSLEEKARGWTGSRSEKSAPDKRIQKIAKVAKQCLKEMHFKDNLAKDKVTLQSAPPPNTGKAQRVIRKIIGGYVPDADVGKAKNWLVYQSEIGSYITFGRLLNTQRKLDWMVGQKLISQKLADTLLLEPLEPVRDDDGNAVIDGTGGICYLRRSIAEIFTKEFEEGRPISFYNCHRTNEMQAIAVSAIKGSCKSESMKVAGIASGHHILGLAIDGNVPRSSKISLRKAGIYELTGIITKGDKGHFSIAETSDNKWARGVKSFQAHLPW
jgi:hypothetical protein